MTTTNLTAGLTATAACEYSGSHNREVFYDAPQCVEFSIRVADKAAAEELAARFPKSLGIRATTLYTAENTTVGLVIFQAKLVPTKGNDRNETGIRRYRRALVLLEAAGVAIEWRNIYGNGYPTRESFEAALA